MCAEQVRSNAAKRLFDTLKSFKSVPGTKHTATTSQAIPVSINLPNALAISDQGVISPSFRLIRAFALLESMVRSVMEEVDQLGLPEDQRSFYIQALPPIVEAISPARASMNWDEFLQQISPVMLRDLQHIDWTLSRYVSEKVVAHADLAVLADTVATAIKQLAEAPMDPTLRDFIMQQLLKIQHSIEQYRFRGAQGLKESLAVFAGSLTMAGEPVAVAETDKPLRETLKAVLKTGNDVLTAAKSVAWAWPHLLSGAEYVQRMLP